MEYNLKDHGDELEKKYSDFIINHLPKYEKVWKIYIGNRGDNTKSEIPNYPIEREKERQNFSEHSYTILQSVIILHRQLTTKVFEKPKIDDIDDILDFQSNLLLFFTNLGRIHDVVKYAAGCLIGINNSELISKLNEIYYKRHVLVHGKTLPLFFSESNDVFMPTLSKDNNDIRGWNHKKNLWEDFNFLHSEKVFETVDLLFIELIGKLNYIFNEFHVSIKEELTALNCDIIFLRDKVKPLPYITVIPDTNTFHINRQPSNGKWEIYGSGSCGNGRNGSSGFGGGSTSF